MQKNTVNNIGFFIYTNVEDLDLAGPLQVFTSANEVLGQSCYNTFTIGTNSNVIKTVSGLSIVPDYTFENHPEMDMLIVPGGFGSRKAIELPENISWIQKQHKQVKLFISICSGARFLAKAGLLNDKKFCTHHEVYEHIQELEPSSIPFPDKRFIQSDDKTYTSAGITAGMDLSFYVLQLLQGIATAKKAAQYMEYETDIEKIVRTNS